MSRLERRQRGSRSPSVNRNASPRNNAEPQSLAKCWNCNKDHQKCERRGGNSPCVRCLEKGYTCGNDQESSQKGGSRRILTFLKCEQCRVAKVKCNPAERTWPGVKCDRCKEKDLPCSEPLARPKKRSRPADVALQSNGPRKTLVNEPTVLPQTTPVSRPSPERLESVPSAPSPNLQSTPETMQIEHSGASQQANTGSRASNGIHRLEQSFLRTPGDTRLRVATPASESSLNAIIPSRPRTPSEPRQTRETHSMQPYRDATLESFGDSFESKIDIVAIHGLNMHGYRSWTAPSPHQTWLRDFQPRDTVFSTVRILLFNYDAEATFLSQGVHSSVARTAKLLLDKLAEIRSRDTAQSPRPLIFMAHSLGGLIVKSAISQALEDTDHPEILESISGNIFFGNPNGISEANSRIYAMKKVRVDHLLEASKLHQYSVDKYDQGLAKVLSDLPTLRFLELQDGLNVYHGSSNPSSNSFAWEGRSINVPLSADHLTICNFENKTLEDQDIILKCMKSLVTRAVDFKKTQKMEKLRSTPFLCPHTHSPYTVRRKQIMDTLTRTFSTAQGSSECKGRQSCRENIVSLYGLGGIGKTHIAIQFAYEFRKQHPQTAVFWVDGSSHDSFHRSYETIAEECGITSSNKFSRADIPSKTLEWLQNASNMRWLLIIDNADNPEDYFAPKKFADTAAEGMAIDPEIGKRTNETDHVGDERKPPLGKLIPHCEHGSILVTTRNKETALRFSGKDVLQVPSFDSIQSVELLQYLLNDKKPTNVDHALERLANVLQHLPLALVQAAKYIEKYSLSVTEYLQVYKEGDGAAFHLLSLAIQSNSLRNRWQTSITWVWMDAFDRIEKSSPRTAELLKILIFFGCEFGIPELPLREKEESLYDLRESIGTLAAYSFVTKQRDECIQMHRFTRLIGKGWLEKKGNHELSKNGEEAAKRLKCCFEEAGNRENRKESGLDLLQIYASHADTVISEGLRYAKGKHLEYLNGLIELLGDYYIERGIYEHAIELFERHIFHCEKASEESSTAANRSILNLARAFICCGRYEEAEDTLDSPSLSKLDSSHEQLPNLLLKLENQLRLRNRQGSANEAVRVGEDLLRKILPKGDVRRTGLERITGDCRRTDSEHATEKLRRIRRILAVRSEVAVALRQQGKFDKALKMQKEAFVQGTDDLGLKHPEVLVLMVDLATSFATCEDKQGAQIERLYITAYEGLKRELTASHPSTISASCIYCWYLGLQGRHREAEERLQETLSVAEDSLDAGHPDLMLARSLQVLALSRNGKDDAANQLVDKLFKSKAAGTFTSKTLSTGLLMIAILAKSMENGVGFGKARAFLRILEQAVMGPWSRIFNDTDFGIDWNLEDIKLPRSRTDWSTDSGFEDQPQPTICFPEDMARNLFLIIRELDPDNAEELWSRCGMDRMIVSQMAGDSEFMLGDAHALEKYLGQRFKAS